MRRRARFFGIGAALVLCLASSTLAGAAGPAVEWGSPPEGAAPRTIPSTVWFQGFLADVGTGDPVNATYDITAELFTVENGGSPVWGPESHDGTTIVEGWFNLELGSTVPLPAFDSPPYYLQLTIDNEELAPRQKLASVPTALRSSLAEEDDGDWSVTGNDVHLSGGFVGIGTSAPARPIHIHGTTSDNTTLQFTNPVTGTTADDGLVVGIDSAGHGHVMNLEGKSLSIGHPAQPRIYVETDGRVGIGTTGPARELEVNGAVEADTYYGDGSNLTGIVAGSDGDWTIDGGNVYRASGRVGIGIASPGTVLDLAGVGTEVGGAPGWNEVVGRFRQTGANHTGLSIDAGAGRDGILYLSENGLARWDMRNDASLGHNLEFRYHERSGSMLYVATADTTGQWGFGTRSPEAIIHGVAPSAAVDPLKIEAPSVSPALIVDGSGRVGVGERSTGWRLQVTAESGGALGVDTYTSAVGGKIQRKVVASSGDVNLWAIVPEGSSNSAYFIDCSTWSDPVDPKFRVHADGDVTADGTVTGGGADLAEMIQVGDGAADASAGDVMIVDASNPRAVVRSRDPRSALVAGIYSTEPGFIGSVREWDGPATERAKDADTPGGPGYSIEDMASEFDEIPLAVVGIVPCKVTTENGAIGLGDLLVSSSTPGHAMRDDAPAVGTVIGKALGSLESGEGVIDVLVTLQ